jgi:hypothetical protein
MLKSSCYGFLNCRCIDWIALTNAIDFIEQCASILGQTNCLNEPLLDCSCVGSSNVLNNGSNVKSRCVLRLANCKVLCDSKINHVSSSINSLVYAVIMDQKSKFTHLVHVLAVNFDIVDGNIGADDGNRYDGCDSIRGLKVFAFGEFTELDPIVAIYGPDRMDGCSFQYLRRSISANRSSLRHSLLDSKVNAESGRR